MSASRAIMLTEGVLRWLREGQHGISSKAIVAQLTGLDISGGFKWGDDHPRDPDDLCRCRLLFEMAPELKPRLHEMSARSHVWASLVSEWDQLCAMMDAEAPQWRDGFGSAPNTYRRMNDIGC